MREHKEINNFPQIAETLKFHYRKIHNLKDDEFVTKEQSASLLDMTSRQLESHITKANTPHIPILRFCKKYSISTDEVYFMDVKITCIECGVELTEINKVYHKTVKNKDGASVKKVRRVCKICYNKKEEKRQKLHTGQGEHECT